MGDNRSKPAGRGAPGSRVDRVIEVVRPMALAALAFARALPGHTRNIVERAELPRRFEAACTWVEAQNFPARARKLGHAATETGQAVGALAREVTASAVATAGPVAASAAARIAAMAKRLAAAVASRSAALSAALDKRRSAAAARKAERRAVANPEKAAMPVPSELMRLLQEEGVEVNGNDVRDALPQPLRPAAIQGVLPLFADDPSPPPGSAR